MPNHFEAIGFAVRDEDDVNALASRAIREGQLVRVAGGEYHRWTPGGGPEVWVQVTGRRWLGITPHFAGSTSMRAGIVGRVRLPDDTPLEGHLYAWANPPAEGPLDAGDYPFVFAVPDFRTLDGMRVPVAARVQIAAFAHDLELFATEEAYLAAQDPAMVFAPESFIPAGMFGEEGEEPEPMALINGRVLAAERRENPAGMAFWWMHVRTLGGEVDVVAEEALVAEPPVVGGMVSGEFYLTGRVTPDAPSAPAEERSWWRRVTGR